MVNNSFIIWDIFVKEQGERESSAVHAYIVLYAASMKGGNVHHQQTPKLEAVPY